MRATYPAGARIHVFGMGALKYLMTAAGFELADEDVQAVVVGAKLDLVYDDLKTATLLIRAGADFIGTNSDPTYPTPDGLQPGTGAMLAAVSTAAGREPDIVVGKPGKPMFEAALREMGTAPEHTLMIGDRLTTDILGGQQAGLKTGLVLTGVTTRAEAETSEIRADGVFDGLAELMADWGL
jgi:4-nitrophenyl phosphatase